MKKNVSITILLFFISFHLISQSLSPSVLSVQEGFYQINGIVIEWTLGEYLTETVTPGDKIFTQGFHQPFLKIVNYDEEDQASLVNIAIFPNPVYSILNIQIHKDFNYPGEINLFDSAGNFLKFISVFENEQNIPFDMTYLASGIYLLSISDSLGTNVATYRIIKN